MPDEPIDDRGWQLFFDVLDGRHPAIDLPRARNEVFRLRTMVRGATLLNCHPSRLKWNPDGYWVDGKLVGDIEDAFYQAGKEA